MKSIFSYCATFLIGAFIAFSACAAPDLQPIAAVTGGAGLTVLHITLTKAIAIPTDALCVGMMSIEDLKAEAENLSNYNGDRMNFYTGQGDDLLDFTGSINNFAGEFVEHLEKQFVVSVVNANAAQRIAVLYAGYMKGNATLRPGQIVEGAFNDKNGAAGLTGATQSEKSIEELLLYLNDVPTRLLAIKVKSTVADQISQKLIYQRLNPFRTEPTKIIRPDNFQNQDTFQDKQVTFPVNVQLDSQSTIEMPIVGASTCYITYYFGTGINMSQALERKADRAITNIAMVGRDKVLGAAVADKALLGT